MSSWLPLLKQAPDELATTYPGAVDALVAMAHADLYPQGIGRQTLEHIGPMQMGYWIVTEDSALSPFAAADAWFARNNLLDIDADQVLAHALQFCRWGISGHAGEWSAVVLPGLGLDASAPLPTCVLDHVGTRLRRATIALLLEHVASVRVGHPLSASLIAGVQNGHLPPPHPVEPMQPGQADTALKFDYVGPLEHEAMAACASTGELAAYLGVNRPDWLPVLDELAVQRTRLQQMSGPA